MIHRPSLPLAVVGALLLPFAAAAAQVNRPLPAGRPTIAPRPAATTTAAKPDAPPAAPAASCSLQYERADNALAALGRPDGDLGVETLALTPGNSVVFDTDWKYEKRRGDANARFGSHLRRARNTGNAKMIVTVREVIDPIRRIDRPDALYAGESASYRADLVEVRCFPPPPTNVCTLEYERADNGFAARGRPDGDLGKETLTLDASATAAFMTSLQYEKLRGTAKARYGTNLRRATNTGQRDVQLRIEKLPGDIMSFLHGLVGGPGAGIAGAGFRQLSGEAGLVTVPPGKQILTVGHLASVRCP